MSQALRGTGVTALFEGSTGLFHMRGIPEDDGGNNQIGAARLIFPRSIRNGATAVVISRRVGETRIGGAESRL
jgi:hypothetical protein